MAKISNSPVDRLTLQLEQRKSFSLGLWFMDSRDRAIDLTGATLRFTAARATTYPGEVVEPVIEQETTAAVPETGFARIDLQAADLALDPRVYQFVVTLVTAGGFSAVVVKGDVVVLENPESDSVDETFPSADPTTSIEVQLRKHDVHVQVTHTSLPLPGGLTSEERAKLAGIEQGAEVNVNADWSAADGDAAILNKPTLGSAAAQDVETFAAAVHTHTVADIVDIAESYAPLVHTHTVADIVDIDDEFAPISHTHSISQIPTLNQSVNSLLAQVEDRTTSPSSTPGKLIYSNANGHVSWPAPLTSSHTATMGYVDEGIKIATAGWNGTTSPGAIPGPIDFDDYKTPGIYTFNSNVNAAASTNAPTPQAGTLEVFGRPLSTTILNQRYTVYGASGSTGGAVFSRAFYGGSSQIWSPWRQLYFPEESTTVNGMNSATGSFTLYRVNNIVYWSGSLGGDVNQGEQIASIPSGWRPDGNIKVWTGSSAVSSTNAGSRFLAISTGGAVYCVIKDSGTTCYMSGISYHI